MIEILIAILVFIIGSFVGFVITGLMFASRLDNEIKDIVESVCPSCENCPNQNCSFKKNDE